MSDSLYITGNMMKMQSAVTLQNLTILESAASAVSSSVTASQLSCDDETIVSDLYDVDEEEIDTFQCGRCKLTFTDLSLFMGHKRRRCLPPKMLHSDSDNPEDDEGIKDLTTGSASFDDVSTTVLTSLSGPAVVVDDFGSATDASLPSVESAPVQLQLTPSVMIREDNGLAFSIPVDQHATLTQLMNAQAISPVLSVSETDLTNFITNSGCDRFHMSSIEQINSPLTSHGIVLTASIISSNGKQETIHIVPENPISTSSRDITDQVTPTSIIENISVGSDGIGTVIQIHSNSHNENLLVVRNTVQSELPVLNDPKYSELYFETAEPTPREYTKRSTIIENSNSNAYTVNDQTRSCNYCGKHFKKLFNLHQHIRSHTGEKPFHCLVCGRGFTQKSNVKKHMQTHKVWPKIKSTLPKEQISVKRKSDVDNGGNQLVYVVNNFYVCQYCEDNQSFENYHKLKTHLSTCHKKEKLFKCIHKDCIATFVEVEGLIHHMKTHEAELEFQCQNCPKKFKTLLDLGSHQITHRLYPNRVSVSAPKQFRCVKCNNKYASSEALNHHVLTSSHSYPCSQCKLVFVCERYLRRHLRVHGTVEPFSCNICGKMFKTENYLKSHAIIHSDSKPFRCEFCNMEFNRRDKLSRHKLMHDTRKKFKCPFKSSGCLREFYRKDKLKDHLLAHSRKVYPCSKCDKTFSWPTRLRHHLAANHPEMLINTTCPECKKIFKTKHHLGIHVCRPPHLKDCNLKPGVQKIQDKDPESPG